MNTPHYPKFNLSFDNLTCFRGKREVFRNLNLKINAGTAYQIAGANGSGKTSLLRMVAGLLSPVSGNINAFVNTQSSINCLSTEERQACLHYIGHQDAIKEHLSLKQQLHYWSVLLKNTGQELNEEDINEAFALLGLFPLADRPAGHLSAGQRRRLALSRLVLFQRPLWLLDEPLTALDQSAITLLNQLIEEHKQKGGIALIASHDTLFSPNGAQLPTIDITALSISQHANPALEGNS